MNADTRLMLSRVTLAKRIAMRGGSLVTDRVLSLVQTRLIGYADLCSDSDRAAYYDAAAYVRGVREARQA